MLNRKYVTLLLPEPELYELRDQTEDLVHVEISMLEAGSVNRKVAPTDRNDVLIGHPKCMY